MEIMNQSSLFSCPETVTDLVSLNHGEAVVGGLTCEMIEGHQVWCQIRLDWIKGDCWALAEVCALLSAVFL